MVRVVHLGRRVTIVGAMNQLHLLQRLQEIDDEIGAGKRRLREVLLAQKGNPALEEARSRRAVTEAALREGRSQQKGMEQQLNQVVDKRRRSSDRLYSGTVSNPKELSDLQNEIDALARRRSDLEDSLLELMIEVEAAQEADDVAGAELEEMEAAWAEQREALAGEQDRLAARLNALLEQRQKQAAAVDASFLSAYESTRQKRGGVAVAVVKDGLCQACGVRVSSSKVSLAHSGSLARCGSCDRIIVSR